MTKPVTERTVADVMTRDVYAVAADTSLDTAARLLTTRRISGCPVVSGSGRPIGVVTLADLADPDRDRSERDGYPLYYRVIDGHRREQSDGAALGTGCVADVMSPFVLSVASSASLREAGRVMLSDGVHRLLVVEDGSLVGIVTSSDLLRGFVEG